MTMMMIIIMRHSVHILIFLYIDVFNRPENLEVEPEGEVHEDEKALIFCKVKWKKAIKEMRDKKATGDDDVPGDV
jgi:hypothetical protein